MVENTGNKTGNTGNRIRETGNRRVTDARFKRTDC